MAETINRGYPIPDPAAAIHPGVRDLAVAIDADIGGLIDSILIDPLTLSPVVDPVSLNILTE